MNEKLTIVILAAGLGTRMKSRKAKVLHEAGGLTLIEHVVRSAVALTPPHRIVVVVGHQAEQVREKLKHTGVGFAVQTEQRGTGHALEVCRNEASGTEGRLIVLYGDCPLLSVRTLQRLLEHQSASGMAATVIATEVDNPTGYGRVIVDRNGRVAEIVEEKVATPDQKAIRLINSGIYCFEAEPLWKYLQEVRPNPVSNEYYLTDIVEVLGRAGHAVSPLIHDQPDELMGINTRAELALVDRVFRDRKGLELMLAGVTIVRPETVTLDTDVDAGMDTVIEPFVQLLGSTRIGENSRIGAGAIIRDSQIADGVDIQPYTLINSSRVDAGASVGPFARLRLENHVEANAHIGNFVELKKTRFGQGAKAGHLAYLGDSNIGKEVNIGAGTITCNFDGARKHQTTIKDGAFVGSNSTLVAPVEIGDKSYVGAGSVITSKVPEDALGIGRGKQVNKAGWAKRRREQVTGQ
jgi:bifunctional UDP-N-acetylglucosamine pyrophosphorylase / glucosamine-1-phosphate N-acetyltransferase